jgi:hypothetical protein
MAVGRISGPLLKDNLLRNGVNLAFETSLLYLDVVNSRVGINNAAPLYDLDVNGTTRTTNLIASANANLATFTFNNNTLSSTSSTINFLPSGGSATVYQGIASIGNINIASNNITATNTNGAINITANGTGGINLGNTSGNVLVTVTGNLHATGNITADGNITLGANSGDTITFDGEVNSDIVPSANNTYNLGSNTLSWSNLYTNTITTSALTTTNFSASGNLSVTGTSTLSGNTTIGATSANTLNIVAGINSNLIPTTTTTYDIGSISRYWNNAYIRNLSIYNGLQISSNSITSTGTNANLTLSANGSGTVYIPSNNLQINNNATVGGTLGVTGTSTLAGVGITGSLTQTGNFTQTSGNFSTTGTINSGAITSTGTLTLPTVTINNSTITGTQSGTNLQITAASGKNVEITSNATLDGNTAVGGTLSVTGTSTLAGVGITGTLTQTGNFTQTSGNFSTTGTISSGAITGSSTLTLPYVTINGSSIAGTQTNTNLQISANGTGSVEITSPAVLDNNASVGGTLAVTGTSTLAGVGITGSLTQTGDFTQTGNFSTSGNLTVNGTLQTTNLTIGLLSFANSTISTTVPGTDLFLTANGTGNVVVGSLQFNNNTISATGSNANVTLTPQSNGNVVINTNQSLIIPVGTTAQQPNPASNGMIRYNTDHNRYEGYSGSYWQNLGGVQSVDGKTYITPESSPGAGNNVISFYANNVNTAYIDSSKLYTVDFQTSGLDINTNTISATATNTDINFTTSGTGGVLIGNLRFSGNTITNVVSDAVTTFNETGAGYVQITGTNGFVIPVGNNMNYPQMSHTTTGMMRFNTDNKYVEIYSGTGWNTVAGTSAGVNTITATDIALGIVLSLG